jgi:hypothetical protein
MAFSVDRGCTADTSIADRGISADATVVNTLLADECVSGDHLVERARALAHAIYLAGAVDTLPARRSCGAFLTTGHACKAFLFPVRGNRLVCYSRALTGAVLGRYDMSGGVACVTMIA